LSAYRTDDSRADSGEYPPAPIEEKEPSQRERELRLVEQGSQCETGAKRPAVGHESPDRDEQQKSERRILAAEYRPRERIKEECPRDGFDPMTPKPRDPRPEQMEAQQQRPHHEYRVEEERPAEFECGERRIEQGDPRHVGEVEGGIGPRLPQHLLCLALPLEVVQAVPVPFGGNSSRAVECSKISSKHSTHGRGAIGRQNADEQSSGQTDQDAPRGQTPRSRVLDRLCFRHRCPAVAVVRHVVSRFDCHAASLLLRIDGRRTRRASPSDKEISRDLP
jgi:hypothetical protein